MLFLVPAAFPVDECPTLAIEDEDQEVMFYATYKTSVLRNMTIVVDIRHYPFFFKSMFLKQSISIRRLLLLKPFHYQLMHTMLKNTELLKHSKITLQHVSVYAETIFRELQSVLG